MAFFRYGAENLDKKRYFFRYGAEILDKKHRNVVFKEEKNSVEVKRTKKNESLSPHSSSVMPNSVNSKSDKG